MNYGTAMLSRTTRAVVWLAAITLGLVLMAAPVAAATSEPIPSSMSALGDSISRGFNACGFFQDCPSRSWSSGIDAGINSHYLRILAKNGLIESRNYNDSETGARMGDLNGQVQAAVARQAEYVTILMGANDACTSSEASMTPVGTFRDQFNSALGSLKAGLPEARIFVASIPDIYRLWQVGKDHFDARNAWRTFGICQSMLDNPLSTSAEDQRRRLRVRQRVIDYNTQLRDGCTATPHCDFDGNAAFSIPFNFDMVSQWDYFHPNAYGQKVLAAVTYRTGFNW